MVLRMNFVILFWALREIERVLTASRVGIQCDVGNLQPQEPLPQGSPGRRERQGLEPPQ